MNLPGTPSGNWRWRYQAGDLLDRTATWMRRLNEKSGRGWESAE
jgi:4-alpha-glucanotransferase